MPLPVFGQSPSKTTETLRLLRHLARQNVYAHLPLSCAGESSGGRENFELIRLGKDDEANILATMDLGTLKKAAKAGWVIEEKSNRCIDDCEPGLWRLSNAGRLHLKRALTRNKPVDQTAKSRPPSGRGPPRPPNERQREPACLVATAQRQNRSPNDFPGAVRCRRKASCRLLLRANDAPHDHKLVRHWF